MLKRIDTPRWRKDLLEADDEFEFGDITGILAIRDACDDVRAAIFYMGDCRKFKWSFFDFEDGKPTLADYEDLDRLVDDNEATCQWLGLRDKRRFQKGRYDNAQCVDDYSYGGIFDAHPAT